MYLQLQFSQYLIKHWYDSFYKNHVIKKESDNKKLSTCVTFIVLVDPCKFQKKTLEKPSSHAWFNAPKKRDSKLNNKFAQCAPTFDTYSIQNTRIISLSLSGHLLRIIAHSRGVYNTHGKFELTSVLFLSFFSSNAYNIINYLSNKKDEERKYFWQRVGRASRNSKLQAQTARGVQKNSLEEFLYAIILIYCIISLYEG